MSLWDGLNLPAKDELSLKMIETDSDFIWSAAKNCEGHIGFVIELNSTDHDTSTFEKTKELEVDIKIYSAQAMLSVFFINNEAQRPLEELLNDLINKTNHIKNEFELINHLKARYNAWCLLFKPGRKKLKENEILGLAAELLFAEIWTQKLGESIEGWVGPLKKHQDFISLKNKLAYEIKLGNWDPESVKISSIEQLDFDGSLSLVVFPGKISDKNEKSAKSLSILIEELKKLLSKEEVFVLENRLMAAGFDEKECQDIFFEIGRPMIFEISEDFPKLIRNIVPNAISKCSYTLVLSDLDSYKVDLTN